MSRHRNVRNWKKDVDDENEDEYDDQEYSDSMEEYIYNRNKSTITVSNFLSKNTEEDDHQKDEGFDYEDFEDEIGDVNGKESKDMNGNMENGNGQMNNGSSHMNNESIQMNNELNKSMDEQVKNINEKVSEFKSK